MVKYQIIPVTAFKQNCTLLWCEQTKEAVIVDPGGNAALIQQVVNETQVTVKKILLTHAHLDHVGAAVELAQFYQIPIIGPHIADRFWLQALPMQSENFDLPPIQPFTPDSWLNEHDVVTFGQIKLEVLHCPGHTPGHIVYIEHEARLALVGDVLFKGSIGRTDFPFSSFNDLIQSIQTKLWPLGDDIVFICGHGPMSSFGEERKNNPFVGQAN